MVKVQKQTNGKVFSSIKCVRIAGTAKDFRGINFKFMTHNMSIFYGVDTGNKFFWTINEKTQQSNKLDFYKWLNGFAGPDVRKLAGYTKLMRALKEADLQSATNGSAKKAPTDGRGNVAGVPMFTEQELTEMKGYQLDALRKQIDKAAAKQVDGSSALDDLIYYTSLIEGILYDRTYGAMLPDRVICSCGTMFEPDTHEEAKVGLCGMCLPDPADQGPAPCLHHDAYGCSVCGADYMLNGGPYYVTCSCGITFSPYDGMDEEHPKCHACFINGASVQGDEAARLEATSGSGQSLSTDGVKEGSEEQTTVKGLRAKAKGMGIKGYSRMSKMQLMAALPVKAPF